MPPSKWRGGSEGAIPVPSWCDATLTKTGNFNRHLTTCKQKVKVVHACPDCEKVFPSESKQTRHQLMHTRSTFTCERCFKSYKQEDMFEQHKSKCDATPYCSSELDLSELPTMVSYGGATSEPSTAHEPGLNDIGRTHGKQKQVNSNDRRSAKRECVAQELVDQECVTQVAQERVIQEFVDLQGAEQELADSEHAEQECVDSERVHQECVDSERVEQERVDSGRVEEECVNSERVQQECVDSERVDSERVDSERVDSECVDSERVDSERIDSEHVDSERVDSEQVGTSHHVGIQKSLQQCVDNLNCLHQETP